MISITAILLRDHYATLARANEAYTRVSIAVADAFVGCWKCKYTFCWERPKTVIHAIINSAWQPAWVAPSFPEFVSGHAS